MTVRAEDAATWVSRFVRIPSVNPLHAGPRSGACDETAFAHELADVFDGLGATVELDDVVDRRPNIYARIPGRTDQLAVIDAHLDTVTVENMTDEPFDGRIDDARVWGRGALDTKASIGVACALLDDWRRNDQRPEPTLLFVGSISEEAGGLLGATAFRSWARREELRVDQLVVCEPTSLRPIFGHKGAIGLRVTVRGLSAHSSTPDEGRNAIYAAARIIGALEAHHGELATRTATTPVGTGTLTVSMIEGGVAPNIIPDRCVLTVGRRLVPGEDPRAEFDVLRALITSASELPVDVEPIFMLPDGSPGSVAFYSPAESDLVRVLSAAAATSPATAPFGTNALRYSGFAREACVFGPGRIEDAHKETECVEISDLSRLALCYDAWLRPS